MHAAWAALAVSSAMSLAAQAPKPPEPSAQGFVAASLEVEGTRHRYVVFVPPGYSAERRWPLLVFLHGMGECGTDGWRQVSVGLGTAIQHDVARWPFVVVFPQKPDKPSQWEEHEAMVMAIADRAVQDYAIDPARQFLTGLSQGGHGTWVLGGRHARRWAAIAPVCGYGDPKAIAPGVKDLPIWAFHGLEDRVVVPGETKNLAAAVAKAGGTVETTYYEKVGHDSWNRAYRESPLAEWFLAPPAEREVLCALAAPDGIEDAVVEVVRRPAEAGAGSEPRWRVAVQDGAAARAAVVERLRGLQAGGVFALPEPLAPDGAAAGIVWEVSVAMRRAGRPFTFVRQVAGGEAAPPNARAAAAAVAACAEAIERLR